MATFQITDKNFKKEVLDSKLPVLVDFWAEWCLPCKMIGPVLEELSEDERIKGKIKIGKLNVEENPTKAADYEIMGIPTLILFKDGREVKRLVGVRGKEEIMEEILRLTRERKEDMLGKAERED